MNVDKINKAIQTLYGSNTKGEVILVAEFDYNYTTKVKCIKEYSIYINIIKDNNIVIDDIFIKNRVTNETINSSIDEWANRVLNKNYPEKERKSLKNVYDEEDDTQEDSNMRTFRKEDIEEAINNTKNVSNCINKTFKNL